MMHVARYRIQDAGFLRQRAEGKEHRVKTRFWIQDTR